MIADTFYLLLLNVSRAAEFVVPILGFALLILQVSARIRNGKALQKPPGWMVLIVTEFITTKRYYERACLPAVADMREEYYEALSQNRIGKARWIYVRGTYSFFAAIGLDRAFAFVSFFIKAWKSVN